MMKHSNQDTEHNIYNIKRTPTVINGVHESVYQSFNLLEYVKLMLERGDSKETILDIIQHIETTHEETGWDKALESFGSKDNNTVAFLGWCKEKGYKITFE